MYDSHPIDEAPAPIHDLKFERSYAHRTAARSRSISAASLLKMHSEQFPVERAAAEAGLPDKILSMSPLSADEEQDLVHHWKNERCHSSRETVLLSVYYRQFRYLLKKSNVGEDLMDMLQEAAVEAMTRLDAPATGESEKFQTSGLLAALRARNHRHLCMGRQMACRIGIQQKKAMSALLNFDFEDVRCGVVTPAMASKGRDVREDIVSDVIDYLSTEDVIYNEAELPEEASHEEDVLLRHDLKQVAPAVMRALDERARDIIIRRRLLDEPQDADVVGKVWGITPERVRQIERQSLVDMRAWIEGGLTSVEQQKRREALKHSREEAKQARRLQTDRRAVKGVDLIAAREQMSKHLDAKAMLILETRYFSTDRVPTYREIEDIVGISRSRMCVVEAEAFDALRKYFPCVVK